MPVKINLDDLSTMVTSHRLRLRFESGWLCGSCHALSMLVKRLVRASRGAAAPAARLVSSGADAFHDYALGLGDDRGILSAFAKAPPRAAADIRIAARIRPLPRSDVPAQTPFNEGFPRANVRQSTDT